MNIIQVEHLTKDFGNQRGVFDATFAIEQGEVFGFLGPNGAGKTTTIRHLLGFSKPGQGSTSILGLDCWRHPRVIHEKLGYLAGELAFPSEMTGKGYLQHVADMRYMKDWTKAKRLLDMFNLDASGGIRLMSKGMKQKLGIVAAFMHDPEILVLDEPTSGLDPLMQAVFIDLVGMEKRSGKTLFMSSHMFDEVEGTCDRIGIIKQGRMVDIVLPKDIRHADSKTYKIEFHAEADYLTMLEEDFEIREAKPKLRQLVIDISDDRINLLLRALSIRNVKFVSEVKHTLEEHFMNYYEEGK